jgi:hypothetical protein
MLLFRQATVFHLLLLIPIALFSSPKITPDTTLKLFYEHINSQQCESAILLRPNYSLERCQKISEVIIHEADTVFNNGSDSVILVSIDIYTANAKSYFSGYVRLQNLQSEWEINGPYKSQQNYTLAEYINDYVPNSEQQSNTLEASSPQELAPVELNIEATIDPAVSKYFLGEQAIAGNYTGLLNNLRSHLEPLVTQQILLIDRSRSSIYLYGQNNLLQGFFPILSSVESAQIPNGVYQINASQVAGDNKNSPVHLNQLHSFSEAEDNIDANYYLRSLLDTDASHSLLLSPIDLGKLSALISEDVITYMGD